ncbi:ThuA domain-containing protein [Thermostilla marina]
MKRREFLATAGAAAVLSALPFRFAKASFSKPYKVLYYTRSAGFQHSVVARKDGELAFSEKVLTDLGKEYGVEVVCSKDGSVFDGDLDQYDAIALYATGDWLKPGKADNAVPVTEKGLENFLNAVKAGKPVVGFHAATDATGGPGPVSPYTQMIGGRFAGHGKQQEATNTVVPGFPGLEKLGKSIRMLEEWYTLKDIAEDMHVILVQETEGMEGQPYNRPPFPATWAKKYGEGRVFYTSLGHREDVWTSDVMRQIIVAAFAWALGEVDFDPVPNLKEVCPGANQLAK